MFSARGSRILRCLIASWITQASSVTILAPAAGAGAALAAGSGSAAAGTAAAAAGGGTAAVAAGAASTGSVAAAAGGTAAGVATQVAMKVFPAAGIAAPLTVFGLALVVGADADASAVTWDCWKPMLHEKSTAPSRGRLLTDLLNDPAISDYHIGHDSVLVRNRWNESWRIDPLILPWGQVAAHASQIASTSSNLSAALGDIGRMVYPMNTTDAAQPQGAFIQ
eukprot:TRINITY_DN1644_c0_g1_i6.p1 TRINITY_DN1644_c0_g1~~TRINITY_DN1644_c0_g1_i6.p1  ORF type:complete len:223 (+),score=26.89 TRINITY_DN1644_c0_g1_i6:154-822(+)